MEAPPRPRRSVLFLPGSEALHVEEARRTLALVAAIAARDAG